MWKFLSFLCLFISIPVSAQMSVYPTGTYNDAQATAVAQSVSAVLPTQYTVDTLPPCDVSHTAKYAYVTDLGGGPDMTICAGGYWKQIRLGVPFTNPTTTSFTIYPLKTPPIQVLTGNPVTSMMLTIDGSSLYPGYILYIRKPGVIGTGASVGVRVGTSAPLPVLGQSTSVFVWDGMALVQVQ